MTTPSLEAGCFSRSRSGRRNHPRTLRHASSGSSASRVFDRSQGAAAVDGQDRTGDEPAGDHELKRLATLEREGMTTDGELITDVLYGVMWYRLLVGHAPLNDELAHDLIRVDNAITASPDSVAGSDRDAGRQSIPGSQEPKTTEQQRDDVPASRLPPQ